MDGRAEPMSDCVLCNEHGGVPVWHDDRLRVIMPPTHGAGAEPDYAGLCRVVWHAHVAEFSDLADADRIHVMRVVAAVERALRTTLRPDKINLAALGNMVPHLHWHVIPRHRDDPHYPAPIWAARQRDVPAPVLAAREQAAAQVPDAVRAALLDEFSTTSNH
jgi:diadenosine tetraphosphate (Ap4A) HIT family hydrolase